MFKKISLIVLALCLITILISCVNYPTTPLLVKVANVNESPASYDNRFIAVKGVVTANGTQPSLQLGWYDLADDTGTIAILTTPNVPKVGEEFWVSGTVLNAEKLVGSRTVSIFIQEKERVKLGLNYPLIIGGVVLGVLALLVLYLLLVRRKRPVYEPIKKEIQPEKRILEGFIPEAKVSKKTQETIVEEEAVEGAPALLIIKSGKRAGSTFALKKKVMNLGRDSSNEIVIDDPKASRQHAKIKLEEDNFVIYDLASSNGTFVNGEKISNTQLNDGDEIKLL